MKYRGYYNYINHKPKGEWIEIFCSDWNKDYWAFYAYISLKKYEQDIKGIQKLINELNWRDGDVYIELIDHSKKLEKLYMYVFENGYYSHYKILDIDLWRQYGEAVEGEERGDHIGEEKHPPLLEILQIISKNKTPYFKTKNIRRYNTVELTPQHIGHIIKKLRKIGLVEIYRDHGRHYTYRRLFKPQDLPGIIEKLEEEGLYC